MDKEFHHWCLDFLSNDIMLALNDMGGSNSRHERRELGWKKYESAGPDRYMNWKFFVESKAGIINNSQYQKLFLGENGQRNKIKCVFGKR